MTAETTRLPRRALGLIDRLTTELARAGVSYCHWKSNQALDRSLAADNDLDLLIDRDDLARFLEIALDLGFRLAFPPGWKQVPGHLSLYGLDPGTGRLVQIDAQTRLVLGDDMTKNYRLPIERPYLQDVDGSAPIPTPRPELEFLVFVVRMVLKHCPWDAQISYKARLTASELRELAYLEDRVDFDEVDRLRARHLTGISAGLFRDCRRALGRDLGPPARAAVARRLTRALAGYGRHSPATDTALKLFRRMWGRVRGRFLPASGGKVLAGGGRVVALVGGDGSGKSSSVADLESFLGRHFATRRFHMGKPDTDVVGRLARALVRRLPTQGPPSGLPPWQARELTRFPGYPYLLSHLLIARDRYRTHLAARRAAEGGAIAVCDRFPLPGLRDMDAPRLQQLPGLERRPLGRWMAGREAEYYRRLRDPDLALVMRVRPEVAVARRDDQDPDFVRRRAAEVYQREWKEPNVFVVDAERPLEEVRQEVRALVWSQL